MKSPILLIPWQDIKEVSSFVYIKTVEFMARYFKTTGNDFHKFHEDVIKLLDECCIVALLIVEESLCICTYFI